MRHECTDSLPVIDQAGVFVLSVVAAFSVIQREDEVENESAHGGVENDDGGGDEESSRHNREVDN